MGRFKWTEDRDLVNHVYRFPLSSIRCIISALPNATAALSHQRDSTNEIPLSYALIDPLESLKISQKERRKKLISSSRKLVNLYVPFRESLISA